MALTWKNVAGANTASANTLLVQGNQGTTENINALAKLANTRSKRIQQEANDKATADIMQSMTSAVNPDELNSIAQESIRQNTGNLAVAKEALKLRNDQANFMTGLRKDNQEYGFNQQMNPLKLYGKQLGNENSQLTNRYSRDTLQNRVAMVGQDLNAKQLDNQFNKRSMNTRVDQLEENLYKTLGENMLADATYNANVDYAKARANNETHKQSDLLAQISAENAGKLAVAKLKYKNNSNGGSSGSGGADGTNYFPPKINDWVAEFAEQSKPNKPYYGMAAGVAAIAFSKENNLSPKETAFFVDYLQNAMSNNGKSRVYSATVPGNKGNSKSSLQDKYNPDDENSLRTLYDKFAQGGKFGDLVVNGKYFKENFVDADSFEKKFNVPPWRITSSEYEDYPTIQNYLLKNGIGKYEY